MDNKQEKQVFPRQSAVALDFAAIQKFITRDLNKNRYREVYFLKYSKEQVIQFVQNPAKWQRQLREISNNLYNISLQYKRIVNYFASMPKFSYVVEPYGFDPEKVNRKTFMSQYRKALDMIENMNIKHEFGKILQCIFIEDVFYGYEHQSKDAYFFQKLDPLYCYPSSLEDGCLNFQFNFTYFDTYPDRLATFPPEFETKYKLYKADPANYTYQELDSSKTICIKANENFEYAMPPFAGIFESIIDIEDFKALRKSRVELENYKLLIQHLPMREDSDINNDFMIDYDNMIMFHNQAADATPEQVGVITTPMKITEVNFEKSGGVDQDNVLKATREMMDQIGISQLLFNTDKSSSIGLNRSINNDEAYLFMILRQFERWLNRKAKKLSTSSLGFRISILDITYYNEQEFFDRVMTAGEFGFPVKSVIAASIGLTPSALMNMSFLENEVLGLQDTMIPLQSAHTQSGDEEGGAPKKANGKLSSEGLKSRDKKSTKAN